ncbi:MAG: type II toxin-antitoxin system VapC family toxin [Sciscionella sp.]|nr:type II toxin-antitoxin system VapC family toxin [Sciscionella sp.]
MLVPDVNVLLYAFRMDSERHEEYRDWLAAKLTGAEPFGLSELVLSGVVRIATNPRAFPRPSKPEVAMRFCEDILRARAVIPLRPGARHWAIFAELCKTVGAKGNLIPDAYHAALAIENGATWVTTDRGFARFPNLRWQLPLEN